MISWTILKSTRKFVVKSLENPGDVFLNENPKGRKEIKSNLQNVTSKSSYVYICIKMSKNVKARNIVIVRCITFLPVGNDRSGYYYTGENQIFYIYVG